MGTRKIKKTVIVTILFLTVLSCGDYIKYQKRETKNLAYAVSKTSKKIGFYIKALSQKSDNINSIDLVVDKDTLSQDETSVIAFTFMDNYTMKKGEIYSTLSVSNKKNLTYTKLYDFITLEKISKKIRKILDSHQVSTLFDKTINLENVSSTNNKVEDLIGFEKSQNEETMIIYCAATFKLKNDSIVFIFDVDSTKDTFIEKIDTVGN